MNLNNVQKFNVPRQSNGLFSNSSHKSTAEPASNDFNQKFRDQFEEFYGGESSKDGSNKSPVALNQSGSMFFKYNEEEEYVQNMIESGNFPKVTLINFKGKKTSRSNV